LLRLISKLPEYPKEIIMCLILGGLAAGLFGPTKKGIEFLVDKYLYKDRY